MGWLSKILGGGKPNYVLDETYVGLRDQVLDLRQGGLPESASTGGPIAVVMDTGLENDCYTFAAVADGALSLYFSTGGGIIGTGNYARPGQASRELVAGSAKYRSALKPASEFPLPGSGTVALHLVTTSGVFRAEEKEDDLGNGRVPLSAWFHEIHELIAMIRQVSDMKKNEEPLIFAAAMDLTDEASEALASGADPNLISSSGVPAIAVAATSRSARVLKLLLEAGANANVNAETDPGEAVPLLCKIAGADDQTSLELMLDAGADIEASDPTGLTALHIASFLGHDALATRLLERGANIEAREECQYTPLMMAANAGREGAVALLLQKGANPNAADQDKSTPMMFAAQHGHAGIVKLLLGAGASRTDTGNHGMTAADFARQNGHAEVMRLLLQQ
jgi:ankyrin repeat protein